LARVRLRESGTGNCTFIVGNAYDVAKLVPQLVDFVFMANAFHGVPDRLRLALAVRASLRTSAGRVLPKRNVSSND
jgi:hypothetical protein